MSTTRKDHLFVLEHEHEPAQKLMHALQARYECDLFGPKELPSVVTRAEDLRPVCAVVDVTMLGDFGDRKQPQALVQGLRDASPGIMILAWTQILSPHDPASFAAQIKNWGVDDILPKTFRDGVIDVNACLDRIRSILGGGSALST